MCLVDGFPINRKLIRSYFLILSHFCSSVNVSILVISCPNCGVRLIQKAQYGGEINKPHSLRTLNIPACVTAVPVDGWRKCSVFFFFLLVWGSVLTVYVTHCLLLCLLAKANGTCALFICLQKQVCVCT